uniref:Uncharacterized protein n=1 Tax=Anguilla anguilla TaxID=7936 RepID=A0A0E9TC93_ANGAN
MFLFYWRLLKKVKLKVY